MKKLLLAGTATLALTGAASAEDVKMGIILGFTGPLESITPNMASGAELAVNEVNEAGTLLEGSKVTVVRADSTCVDAAAATAAAERLVTSDKVQGIMGADCSGVTGAVLQNVARPNGVVMISPSATSPALSEAEDDGLFFRTAPSDARQGEVIAEILKERDIGSVAITYTNNDYGKGLADSIQQAFEKAGGKVTISAAHEDGKADYSAEVAALAAAGGDMLVVAGYVDQGGKGVIQAALDTGAFETFFLPDGMYGDALVEAIGSPLDGSFGTVPGTDSEGATKILDMAKEAGFDGTSSLCGRELRRGVADPARDAGGGVRGPGRLQVEDRGSGERAWRKDLSRRSRQGDRAAEGRHRHRLCGRHQRRADRPRRERGQLPGIYREGRQVRNGPLPLRQASV